MARRFALGAEVVECADEALPEVMHPYPVDHDACGERVLFAGDALGEFQAAAAELEGLRFAVGKDLEEMARNDFAPRLGLAADEDGRILRIRLIDDDHGAGRSAGIGEEKLVDLGKAELATALELVGPGFYGVPQFFGVELIGGFD